MLVCFYALEADITSDYNSVPFESIVVNIEDIDKFLSYHSRPEGQINVYII